MRRSVVCGRARVVVLAVAVWLVAVTGTTTLAWIVIDRAGRSIGSTPTALASDLGPPRAAGSPSSGGSTARSATASATPSGQPHARPPVTASRSASPSPSAARPTATGSVRAPAASTSPSASPSASPSTSTSRQPTTSPTGRPATGTPPPVPTGVQRVAHVQGGQVAVRCKGASIALRGAQPDDGWSVETGSRGSAELEVTFRSSAGGVERETQVHAACQRGEPVLTVETQTSSGD